MEMEPLRCITNHHLPWAPLTIIRASLGQLHLSGLFSSWTAISHGRNQEISETPNSLLHANYIIRNIQKSADFHRIARSKKHICSKSLVPTQILSIPFNHKSFENASCSLNCQKNVSNLPSFCQFPYKTPWMSEMGGLVFPIFCANASLISWVKTKSLTLCIVQSSQGSNYDSDCCSKKTPPQKKTRRRCNTN